MDDVPDRDDALEMTLTAKPTASTRGRQIHLPRLVGSLLIATGIAAGTQLAVGALSRDFDFDRQLRLVQARYGDAAFQRARLWRDLLVSLRDAPEMEKVRRVNDFFNRQIDFREDIEIWRQSDYWATPVETLGRAQGDCEDFSIAKYFSLRILEVPTDRLRMIYVKARIGGSYSRISQAHMILGYYPDPDAEPLILDNLLHDIRPSNQRPDLTPVFSFGSDGLWVGRTPGGSSTARLSRWRGVLARMQADGFD